jgi:hypothetical protein
MKIQDVAAAYLGNDPNAWLRVAQIFCRVVAGWSAEKAEEEMGITITEYEISDLLLPELMSPVLATIISRSNDQETVGSELFRTVSETLESLQLNATRKAASYSIFIDEGDENVRRDSSATELFTGFDAPLDSQLGYSALDFSFLRYELLEYINEFIQEKSLSKILVNTPSGQQENSLFRLDIIDLALYKALMEHPELLRTLDWRTFEKLLADILDSMGFEIELQRGTKDGGVDIFAIRNQDLVGPQRFLIQAKRYKNKVGVEPVRQLMFLHQHHRVTKVCLATTALFTKGAWNLADQYKWQLELRDFDGVHDWIRQAAKQRCG